MALRFLGSWNDKSSDVSDAGTHNLKYKYQQNKGKAIQITSLYKSLEPQEVEDTRICR
jgi:hypothetical protein